MLNHTLATTCESGHRFVGLGVQPPLTLLNNMGDHGRDHLTRWTLVSPSLLASLTTLPISLLDDRLRVRIEGTFL